MANAYPPRPSSPRSPDVFRHAYGPNQANRPRGPSRFNPGRPIPAVNPPPGPYGLRGRPGPRGRPPPNGPRFGPNVPVRDARPPFAQGRYPPNFQPPHGPHPNFQPPPFVHPPIPPQHVRNHPAFDPSQVENPNDNIMNRYQVFRNFHKRQKQSQPRQLQLHIWLPAKRLLGELKEIADEKEEMSEASVLKIIHRVFGDTFSFVDELLQSRSEDDISAIHQILHEERERQNGGARYTQQQIAHNVFHKLPTTSLSHICSYLTRDDVLRFKGVSSLVASECLREMQKHEVGVFDMAEFLRHKQFANLSLCVNQTSFKLLKQNRYTPRSKFQQVLQLWSERYGVHVKDMLLVYKNKYNQDNSPMHMGWVRSHDGMNSGAFLKEFQRFGQIVDDPTQCGMDMSVADNASRQYLLFDKSTMQIVYDASHKQLQEEQLQSMAHKQEWSCQACTFLNKYESDHCEICGTESGGKEPVAINSVFQRQRIVFLYYFDLERQHMRFVQFVLMEQDTTAEAMFGYLAENAKLLLSEYVWNACDDDAEAESRLFAILDEMKQFSGKDKCFRLHELTGNGGFSVVDGGKDDHKKDDGDEVVEPLMHDEDKLKFLVFSLNHEHPVFKQHHLRKMQATHRMQLETFHVEPLDLLRDNRKTLRFTVDSLDVRIGRFDTDDDVDNIENIDEEEGKLDQPVPQAQARPAPQEEEEEQEGEAAADAKVEVEVEEVEPPAENEKERTFAIVPVSVIERLCSFLSNAEVDQFRFVSKAVALVCLKEMRKLTINSFNMSCIERVPPPPPPLPAKHGDADAEDEDDKDSFDAFVAAELRLPQQAKSGQEDELDNYRDICKFKKVTFFNSIRYNRCPPHWTFKQLLQTWSDQYQIAVSDMLLLVSRKKYVPQPFELEAGNGGGAKTSKIFKPRAQQQNETRALKALNVWTKDLTVVNKFFFLNLQIGQMKHSTFLIFDKSKVRRCNLQEMAKKHLIRELADKFNDFRVEVQLDAICGQKLHYIATALGVQRTVEELLVLLETYCLGTPSSQYKTNPPNMNVVKEIASQLNAEFVPLCGGTESAHTHLLPLLMDLTDKDKVQSAEVIQMANESLLAVQRVIDPNFDELHTAEQEQRRGSYDDDDDMPSWYRPSMNNGGYGVYCLRRDDASAVDDTQNDDDDDDGEDVQPVQPAQDAVESEAVEDEKEQLNVTAGNSAALLLSVPSPSQDVDTQSMENHVPNSDVGDWLVASDAAGGGGGHDGDDEEKTPDDAVPPVANDNGDDDDNKHVGGSDDEEKIDEAANNAWQVSRSIDHHYTTDNEDSGQTAAELEPADTPAGPARAARPSLTTAALHRHNSIHEAGRPMAALLVTDDHAEHSKNNSDALYDSLESLPEQKDNHENHKRDPDATSSDSQSFDDSSRSFESIERHHNQLQQQQLQPADEDKNDDDPQVVEISVRSPPDKAKADTKAKKSGAKLSMTRNTMAWQKNIVLDDSKQERTSLVILLYYFDFYLQSTKYLGTVYFCEADIKAATMGKLQEYVLENLSAFIPEWENEALHKLVAQMQQHNLQQADILKFYVTKYAEFASSTMHCVHYPRDRLLKSNADQHSNSPMHAVVFQLNIEHEYLVPRSAASIGPCRYLTDIEEFYRHGNCYFDINELLCDIADELFLRYTNDGIFLSDCLAYYQRRKNKLFASSSQPAVAAAAAEHDQPQDGSQQFDDVSIMYRFNVTPLTPALALCKKLERALKYTVPLESIVLYHETNKFFVQSYQTMMDLKVFVYQPATNMLIKSNAATIGWSISPVPLTSISGHTNYCVMYHVCLYTPNRNDIHNDYFERQLPKHPTVLFIPYRRMFTVNDFVKYLSMCISKGMYKERCEEFNQYLPRRGGEDRYSLVISCSTQPASLIENCFEGDDVVEFVPNAPQNRLNVFVVDNHRYRLDDNVRGSVLVRFTASANYQKKGNSLSPQRYETWVGRPERLWFGSPDNIYTLLSLDNRTKIHYFVNFQGQLANAAAPQRRTYVQKRDMNAGQTLAQLICPSPNVAYKVRCLLIEIDESAEQRN